MILGDNTGGNISDKWKEYGDLTVQYWAWKNAVADYYGLCHYRRFLAFTEKHYRKNDQGLVEVPVLSHSSEQRYGLLDMNKMREIITSHDLVVMEPAPVAKMHPNGGQVNTVREMWDAHDGIFFRKRALDMLLAMVSQRHPEYAASAEAYMEGTLHYGYNCYVMKDSLFQRLCEFQFPILFELEAQLAADTQAEHLPRTLGFMGEILYGIFVYHGLTQEGWRVKELPLVFLSDGKAKESCSQTG